MRKFSEIYDFKRKMADMGFCVRFKKSGVSGIRERSLINGANGFYSKAFYAVVGEYIVLKDSCKIVDFVRG
ncbi:hypothetical protein CBLAS_0894 [Campylobacter blaseri]|uniref:Uncharacterized protein n=1 Tax=Campylobacter blaseri TaxID=2042961 RepID=A0A2P8R2T0_9BACT|nr:hypothetical protein [Campylobacter blaseri]PSM52768.1 hypothetical protein CQ405_03325 [Campylobacter blaseri]PSM54416.1 hypothetical protein CRN67_03325 [Campylobacter blaseri]QKF86079.1 hypothetical protein CBLAS_0894 [Campylobacter blaseri]